MFSLNELLSRATFVTTSRASGAAPCSSLRISSNYRIKPGGFLLSRLVAHRKSFVCFIKDERWEVAMLIPLLPLGGIWFLSAFQPCLCHGCFSREFCSSSRISNQSQPCVSPLLQSTKNEVIWSLQ